MRSKILVIVMALMALFALPTMAQDEEPVITIERQPCFGTCPVYTIEIYADGTVVYEGEDHVEVTGTQTVNLDSQFVEDLIAGFVETGYFDWEDEYTNRVITDQTTVITSVTYDGETKQITHYHGDDSAPIELTYLENFIDTAVSSSQWTGKEPPMPFSADLGSPVITLERGACFGMCPVYNLYLYEDGTVIYVGVRHVDALGVRSTQIEPSAVEWLVTRMNLEGYPEWDEEYTMMIVTDQTTVVTSLNTEDVQHQITRYDGDPNAPVGLVRIENAIDAAVNISQWLPEQPTLD
jgi:NAD-dependent dihydropyrimidine dehydrogenase PreA subunit